MKNKQPLIVSAVLLVLMAALYRIIPGRPFGFAPQIAMALFAGSVIPNKKISFLLPVFSMLLSDLLYQLLFQFNLSAIPGYYNGQLLNYVLFAALTAVGFAVKQTNPVQILTGAISAATVYFLSSNFIVWISGGLDITNTPYPKTITGLVNCYTAAIPFYRTSIYATIIFGAVLFGGYFLINKYFIQKPVLAGA